MATEVRLTRRIHNSVKEALQKDDCPSELTEKLSEYKGNDGGPQQAAIPIKLVQQLWEYLSNFPKPAGDHLLIAQCIYRRGISSPKGPQLSGSRYFCTVKIREQSIPRNS